VTSVVRTGFGSRRYGLWVPARYDGQKPNALLMMLHGCTQTARDFAALSGMNRIADREGFLVVYPEQSVRANFLKCWHWYDARHQSRGAGEPAILAQVVSQVQSSYCVNSQCIYIVGVSAGGAMAVVLAATYPDIFMVVGVVAGAEFKGATSRSSALALMARGGPDPSQHGILAFQAMAAGLRKRRRRRIPLIVFQGTGDRRVNPLNADQLIAQWAKTNECLAEGNRGAGSQAWVPNPLVEELSEGKIPGGYNFTRHSYKDGSGPLMEEWIVHGMDHAWPGASSRFRYGDPKGPNASEEMWRFFRETSWALDDRRDSTSLVVDARTP
jgi:poly(hydroxyalkanoate) depolymerase family esterase